MVTNVVNGINGNDYYDYTQLKMPDAADKTGNGEQFSLAYQRAQEEAEEKEESDKNEESGAVGTGGQRTVVQGGVKLELSGNRHTYAGKNRESARQTGTSGQGFADTIRSWVAGFVQSLKALFYKIWNDPVPQGNTNLPEDGAVQGGTKDIAEPEKLTEEYLALKNLEELKNPENAAKQQIERESKKGEEIQKLLRSGDMEQVISLVTENGHKTMAKNSTLLTYYDRNGKIAPLSASDQERILHGDRNVKEL